MTAFYITGAQTIFCGGTSILWALNIALLCIGLFLWRSFPCHYMCVITLWARHCKIRNSLGFFTGFLAAHCYVLTRCSYADKTGTSAQMYFLCVGWVLSFGDISCGNIWLLSYLPDVFLFFIFKHQVPLGWSNGTNAATLKLSNLTRQSMKLNR